MPPTSGQTIFATAATTAAFAVALLLFGEWFKWVYRRSQEKRLLLAITADLIRHLQRGIERLDEYIPQVQRAALKPAILHIKKLRVDEKSPVFSDENLRYLEEFYARRVSTLRFRLRNFNMDCDFAVDIYEHGDRQALLRTLEYVRNRNRYVKFQVEQAFDLRPKPAPKEWDGLLYFEEEGSDWSDIPIRRPNTNGKVHV